MDRDSKEIERRFNLWSDMLSKTNRALNDTMEKVEVLERGMKALVDALTKPQGA